VPAVTIDLSGKVALVTGGAYGMGRASARRFAACGASVVVADLSDERGLETVELIRAAGGEASFVHTDVRESGSVEDMAAFVEQTYGGLDYAHNNAGIIGASPKVENYPLEQWADVIATNLTGVYLCMKVELPLMVRRGGGAIVNVASETTYKGNVGELGYTASKHGVVGLTTVAALQYVRRGIRVNAIAPGTVETGIVEEARKYLTPEQFRSMETAQPSGRMAQPEEIAEVVVWLCSDGAALINGAKIAADTGWHIT
jgi:NAD(P)-dependent dehydrogenase (short-subunit alcohol dehydrogenase family)